MSRNFTNCTAEFDKICHGKMEAPVIKITHAVGLTGQLFHNLLQLLQVRPISKSKLFGTVAAELSRAECCLCRPINSTKDDSITVWGQHAATLLPSYVRNNVAVARAALPTILSEHPSCGNMVLNGLYCVDVPLSNYSPSCSNKCS